MRIPSVANVKTNSVLLADYVRPLYLRANDVVLDATYGKGNFWTKYKPRKLIKHDLYVLDGVDCRHLPENDESVDVVVLDLPYTSVGGRKTSTIKDFHKAYGLQRGGKTPEDVQVVIAEGIREAYRVLVPYGLLMAKCQDYISGGSFVSGHFSTVESAQHFGFTLIDEFIHYRGGLGAQPTHNLDGSRRRQVHSHRAHSFLCIFQKR